MAITALANLSDAAAGWGTIAYGGYTFPGLRDVRFSSEPVMDDANRAVIDTRYTVRVHAFIVDGDEATHKTTMTSLRLKLTEAGQVLTISGQGIGDIQVNGSGATHYDVEWGPKPRIAETIQIGPICTEIVWECVFAIKDTIGSINYLGLAAFNYEIDWSYADSGVCSRTITGYLQVPLTRSGGSTSTATSRTISNSADSFRDNLRVQVPIGFRRGPRQFHLSNDRARLDFTITDIQLDAEAPPENCLTAELDYDVESVPPGFQTFIATLSGTIETPPGTPTIVAGETFMRILLDKASKLQGANRTVIPLRLRMGRTLTTRQSHFAFAMQVTGCLDDILQQGGIWAPLTETDYSKWAASMVLSGAWDNRARSNLRFNVNDDAVIDLGGGTLPVIGTGGQFIQESKSASSIFGVAQAGYIGYENTLISDRDYNATTHVQSAPYQPADSPNTPPRLSTDVAGGAVAVKLPQSVSPGLASSQVRQNYGAPNDLILMRGKSMTIGIPGEVPSLSTIGGIPVEEVRCVIDGPKGKACVFGSTVFVTKWAILYRLKNGHAEYLPTQTNPVLCCEKKQDNST